MNRIKEGIDEMINLNYNFKNKEKKAEAEVVRNLIIGIPPENDDFTKY